MIKSTNKRNEMTWKDLFSELLLKLNIKINKKPRKLKIQRNNINEFLATATIIKGRNERDVEDRLDNRSITTSYLRTDDRIFEPYVDLLVLTTIGHEHFSFIREIGLSILRLVKKFEFDNSINVNKSHLYFGLSLNSIYLSDTINAMIFWELSQEEESHTQRLAFNSTAAINNTISKFSSVINPINFSLNSNQLYKGIRDNYTFIPDFTVILSGQNTPELFAYFSAGIRFNQVSYWIQNSFTAMTKIYSQELVNTLCILCEANFKNHSSVTNTTFGKILNNDLPIISPAISSIIGHSAPAPKTGLFFTYPTSTETNFNSSFPQLINRIKTNSLTEDELKAHLIYGTYMLRNKTLHDFNSNLIYFNNWNLFSDTIGLLFATVYVVKSL
jgi:hypothetical protein